MNETSNSVCTYLQGMVQSRVQRDRERERVVGNGWAGSLGRCGRISKRVKRQVKRQIGVLWNHKTVRMCCQSTGFSFSPFSFNNSLLFLKINKKNKFQGQNNSFFIYFYHFFFLCMCLSFSALLTTKLTKHNKTTQLTVNT